MVSDQIREAAYAYHKCDQHIGVSRPKLWCGSRLVHEGHHWDWMNWQLLPKVMKMWCGGATKEEVN